MVAAQNFSQFIHRQLRCKLMVLLCLFVFPFGVLAQTASAVVVDSVRLLPTDSVQSEVGLASGWLLSAQFDVQLGFKLQEAADRGLPLRFTVDFQLIQPRWYWSDKLVVRDSYPIELSFHALTRTYRLAESGRVLVFSTLNEAITEMTSLSDWLVIRRDQIIMGQRYVAKVRFSLDVSKMPKPFQVNALTNSQWELASDWLQFEFMPRAGELG